jgi:hypothetical protein
MSSKHFLSNITIPSPCDADWNSMKGNDQVRFCEHCDLSVHNLSQMTRTQAQRLINRSNGRLCVRYYRNSDGGPITRPVAQKLHLIGRRASRLAAGAFTATLSITSAVAQTERFPADISNRPLASQPAVLSDATATIVGRISDQNGAVIPGATIYLSNDELRLALYASTGSDGEFRIENLQAGIYKLQITAPGFATEQVDRIYLQENGENRVDRTMKIAAIEEVLEVDGASSGQIVSMGGAVAIVLPENPFVRAAQEDNLEKLTELIAGMDVNLRDKQSGTTALEHAVRNANREMVQLLLAAGADVNAKNTSGETVLMMVDDDATADMIWDLINAGAQVNAHDDNGMTPLMEVAMSGNVEAVKTLLEAGAKVDSRNVDKQTALMIAASSGEVNMVRALVLAGADINASDKEGNNALSLANENDRAAVVRFLKSRGAFETVSITAQNE